MPLKDLRSRALAFAAFVLCAGCKEKPSSGSASELNRSCAPVSGAIISDSAVGALRLGMIAAEVRGRCQVVRDTVMLNGDYVENQRTMSVVLGADTVRAWLPGDSINEIDVLSERLHTDDSLHVGMKLAQLREITGLTAASSEASTALQVARHCGIALLVSGAPDMGEDGAEANETTIRSWPDSIKVNMIRVSGC